MLLAFATCCASARAQEAPAPAGDPAPAEEVVVTAARAEQAREDVTVATEVIGREEIEASGARTVDELLRAAPGIEVTSTFGGAGVRMQGLEPKHVLVLVDGRPVDGRVDGTVDLARLRVADIERVEVVKGPSSALYGSDALGGVINLVTRASDAPWQAEGSARYGTWRTADASAVVGGHRGDWSGRVRGGLFGTGGYDLDEADEATTADAEEGFDVGASGSWRPTDRATVTTGADYQRRGFAGVDASATGAVFDRTVLEESAKGSLGTELWTGELHKTRAELAPSTWRQQYLSDQRGSDVQDAWSDTRDGRLRLAVGHQRVLGRQFRHFLVGGVDAELAWMTSARLSGGSADRQRVAVYAQDDWKVLQAPRIAVSPGGRLDVDSQFGVHATPRLALRFDPVEPLALRVGAGTGYRAPDFKELYLWLDHAGYGYVVEGNPALRPEVSRGLTADADLDVAPWLALSAGAWRNDVDDLVDIALVAEGDASSSARYQYVNVASARTQGAEAGVAVASPVLRVDLGYTFTDARDLDTDALLEGRAPHRGTVGLTVRPARWPLTADLRGEVVGPRPWDSGDGGRAWSEAYAWLDARLAAEVGAGLSLEAGVKNALDARDDAYLGLPPRTFYAGLVARAGAPDRPSLSQGVKP